MRIAVFSDIHANRQAWRAVHADMEAQGVDGLVCLGDIVGYGPEPQEVLDAIRAATTNIVLGNHDAVIGGLMDSADFNDHARDIIEWTRGQLNPGAAEFFRQTPEMLEGENVLYTHAEGAQPLRFSYLDTPDEVKETFDTRREALIFIGHTHVPCVFALSLRDGSIVRRTHRKLHLRDHERHLVNVGSVGEPRDGDPRASYVIYDDEARTVDFRRVEFDVDGYLADLDRRGLRIEPAFLAAHRFRLEHPEMDPAALTAGAVKAQPAMRKPATPAPAPPSGGARTGTRRVVRINTQPLREAAAPARGNTPAREAVTPRPPAPAPAPRASRATLAGLVLLALAAAGGAVAWLRRDKQPGAPPALPVAPVAPAAPAAPTASAAPASAAPESGAPPPVTTRLARYKDLPGPVWLVRFGKAGGTQGNGPAHWNHLTAPGAPAVNTQWVWKDTRGLLAITATLVASDSALAPGRSGVRGRNIWAFGIQVPDSATAGSWSARDRETAFTLLLTGLNAGSRYVLAPLLAGSATGGQSPAPGWSVRGAPGAEGTHEAANVDGLDLSPPLRPAADGSLRLTFRLASDSGASGLNTLAIKELSP